MRQRQKPSSKDQTAEAHQKTPTFRLELPLCVSPGQAKRLRAQQDAARQFYHAVLSEGQQRLRRLRADLAWQTARAIPRMEKRERARAHHERCASSMGHREYALHEAAKVLNSSRDSRPA